MGDVHNHTPKLDIKFVHSTYSILAPPLQVANHFWTPQKLFGKKTDHLAQQHSTTLIQTELKKNEDFSMPHLMFLGVFFY